MKTIVSILILFLMLSNSFGQTVEFRLANNSELERNTRVKLQHILEEYEVQKWTFTDTVVIEENAIPHSHPVLTLDTKTQSDLSLLAVFIHENIHWHLVSEEKNTSQAIVELKKKFPTVPVGKGEGAINEHSSYVHLLINFLEFDAIRQLAGIKAAKAVLSRKKYYMWIYAQVLQNIDFFDQLTTNCNLKL